MFSVVSLQQKSTLERKLLFAGLLDVHVVETKTFSPLDGAQSLTVSDDYGNLIDSPTGICKDYMSSFECVFILLFYRSRVRRLRGQ